MIHLDYRDSRPIYEQVRDGLRKLMVTGMLRAGDKLPSVRTLAVELAINPNTIQRAYSQLEAEGYIVTVSGKGTFVAELDNQNEARRTEVEAKHKKQKPHHRRRCTFYVRENRLVKWDAAQHQ